MTISNHLLILFEREFQVNSADNCDCACPVMQPLVHSVDTFPYLLRLHPALQTLPLDAEHCVAFVPSSSRMAVINQPTWTLLEDFGAWQRWQQYDQEQQAIIRQCYQLGLLTADNESIPALSSPDTLVAWLHITNACNLRCTYCFVDKTSEAMSGDTARAAVDAVLRSAQIHGYHKVQLKYSGGEATLNMPLIEHTHTYAQQQAAAKGIQVRGNVLSNGTTMTYAKALQIQQLGLRLMISLDGPQAVHDQQRPMISGQGSFQATLEGIARAQEIGLIPDISITVTRQSVNELPELLRWLLLRKLPFSLGFARTVDADSMVAASLEEEQTIIRGMRAAYAVLAETPPQWSVLSTLLDHSNLNVAHQHVCGAGNNYLVIDHRGRIAKCQMLLNEPVATIAAADPLQAVRIDQAGLQNPTVDTKAECCDCEWRYWCAGGCNLETFRATGSYSTKSPNCRIYQALYPDLLRLEGQRLLYHHRQIS
jgi:uncharacterized protein